MTPLHTSIECVLFDLDGTLIDTVPDFIHAVNQLLTEQGREASSDSWARYTVSDGARALVKRAFDIAEDHEQFTGYHERLLELYFEKLMQTESTLYPGMPELLNQLEEANIQWGIVTNKPEKYSRRLLQQLGLLERCQVLICPEQVAATKPDPESLLLACQQLGCNIERTIYVGDHIRDMQAAKNADIIAVAASYGYLSEDARIEEWNADFILKSVDQAPALLTMLKFAWPGAD